jgi:hypothetical protein
MVDKLKKSYAAQGERGISAYSSEGERLKDQFLRDSLSLAREVGKYLPDYTTENVHKNMGGVAVGGDVYAEYHLKDNPNFGVLMTITGSISGRSTDGATIYLQFSEWIQTMHRGKPRRSIKAGNEYVDIGATADEIAQVIVRYAKHCRVYFVR